MKYIIAVMACLTISFSAFGGSCAGMVPFGTPKVTTTEKITLLCRRMYAVAHSPLRHTAYWSAEHLIGKQQLADSPRVNAFKTDPDLPPAEAAKPSDYEGTGWDQGHMAPVGDMHTDAAAMLESFYLSNMVPQAPMNNRDGWNHLEYYVRGLSMKYNEVYVITGPVYQCFPTCKTIGKTGVMIPTSLYKIVYVPQLNQVISFLVANTPFSEKDFPKIVSDLKTVQSMTGITFFPTLPGPITEAKQMWAIK
jgi:endonuclease G